MTALFEGIFGTHTPKQYQVEKVPRTDAQTLTVGRDSGTTATKVTPHQSIPQPTQNSTIPKQDTYERKSVATKPSLTPESLLSSLDLKGRGFVQTKLGEGYWTCRRTDAEKEYTVTLVGTAASTVSRIEVELVSSNAEMLLPLATTFLAQVAPLGASPELSVQVQAWLASHLGQNANTTIGEFMYELGGKAPHYIRLTIRPVQ